MPKSKHIETTPETSLTPAARLARENPYATPYTDTRAKVLDRFNKQGHLVEAGNQATIQFERGRVTLTWKKS